MSRKYDFMSHLAIKCIVHHHNGLGTQNTNLHIMTSAYLWKIDCISVNIDQFSSKFRYVVAKTILYKLNNNHFSF